MCAENTLQSAAVYAHATEEGRAPTDLQRSVVATSSSASSTSVRTSTGIRNGTSSASISRGGCSGSGSDAPHIF